MSIPAAPILPQIGGDLLLDVFTHKSLRFNNAHQNDYGDNDRLATLGKSVVETVVTYFLFCKRPLLTASSISEQRAEILSDETVENWVVMYDLKNKLRYAPDAAEMLKNPEETRTLFNSYVGAVFVQSGLPPIQEWISRLIDPEAEPIVQHNGHQNPYQSPAMPHQQSSVASPSQGAMANLNNLALFNQVAARKGEKIEFLPESVGPSHMPRWTVRLLVNGVEKGCGVGKNQKLAKEDAAKQAMVALQW